MEKELRKQTLKRNIIFWGRNAEKYVFMMISIAFLYAIFLSYMNDVGIWDLLFSYQFMLTQISSFVVSISYGMAYIPLVISFGSKRKEAVWGFQLMNWLVVVQMEAFLLLFAALSSEFSEQIALLISIAPIGMIIGISLGQFVAAVGLKFGMKGMLWITIVVVVISIFTIAITTFIFLLRQEKNQFSEYLLVAGAMLAGILYIASSYVMLRTICNYEVHR